jgi:hypothetical protein
MKLHPYVHHDPVKVMAVLNLRRQKQNMLNPSAELQRLGGLLRVLSNEEIYKIILLKMRGLVKKHPNLLNEFKSLYISYSRLYETYNSTIEFHSKRVFKSSSPFKMDLVNNNPNSRKIKSELFISNRNKKNQNKKPVKSIDNRQVNKRNQRNRKPYRGPVSQLGQITKMGMGQYLKKDTDALAYLKVYHNPFLRIPVTIPIFPTFKVTPYNYVLRKSFQANGDGTAWAVFFPLNLIVRNANVAGMSSTTTSTTYQFPNDPGVTTLQNVESDLNISNFQVGEENYIGSVRLVAFGFKVTYIGERYINSGLAEFGTMSPYGASAVGQTVGELANYPNNYSTKLTERSITYAWKQRDESDLWFWNQQLVHDTTDAGWCNANDTSGYQSPLDRGAIYIGITGASANANFEVEVAGHLEYKGSITRNAVIPNVSGSNVTKPLTKLNQLDDKKVVNNGIDKPESDIVKVLDGLGTAGEIFSMVL